MSPRDTYVAMFYDWLRWIRSVWQGYQNFLSLKLIEIVICNLEGLLYHPVWFQLVLTLFGHYFSTF